MANTKSAKKMVRKIARRTAINRDRRGRMRTFIRKVEEALAEGNLENARTAFQAAEPMIMQTAGKGVLHKRTAARKVSRLAQRIRKLAS